MTTPPTVQPGQRARARPFGWDGSRPSLDSDTFDGDPSPIEGVYRVVRVTPIDLSAYDDHRINGLSIDPGTLEPARLTACLSAPTLGVLEAADHFAVCAEAMSHNDRAEVLAALARVDTDALAKYWVDANAQFYVRQKGAPSVTRAALPWQPREKLPKETKRRLAERDGWRCRYCGVRMLAKDFCWALNKLVDDAFCVSGSDAEKHAAALSLRYTQDHVVPVSRGATNELDELVAACWPCNFAKSDRTLAELGLLDPRDRPPVVDDWDGLVGRFGRPEY